MAKRKPGESKNSGKTGHRFAPGNKFGKGRPVGSRNAATLAVQALLEGEAEEITRKAIELAKSGDTTALRLVLERLVPPVRERHVRMALPAVEAPKDVLAAIARVLEAVAAGQITPGEGQAIAGLLAEQRKHIEMLELEARLAAIEQSLSSKGGQIGGMK